MPWAGRAGLITGGVAFDLGPLEELASPKTLRTALKMAMNKAGGVVKGEIQSSAPSRYGYLGKSIRVKSIVYEGGRAIAVVGASRKYQGSKGKFTRGKRKGEGRKFIPGNYAHLVELGHGGPHPATPHPFLVPSYQRSKNAAVQAVSESIQKTIDRLSAKLKR